MRTKRSVDYLYTMHSVLKTVSIVTILLLFSIPLSYGDEPAHYESTMGIYSDGKKVGYSHISIDNADGLTRVEERSRLNITLLGKSQAVQTEAEYTLRGYEIVSFKFGMTSGAGDLTAEGVMEEGELRIKIKSVSGETFITLPAAEGLTIFALLPKWLSDKHMSIGSEYRIPVFEPVAALMGVEAEDLVTTHKVEARESIDVPSLGTVDTFRVRSHFMGSRYTSWITEEGEVIKQTIPPGLTAVKEVGEGRDGERYGSFDIVRKTSIPSDVKLENPRALEYLRAEVTGVGASDGEGINLDDGYRQYVKKNIVEIRPPDLSAIKGYTLPYNDGTHAAYVSPSYLIQSDDALIKAKSRDIVKEERDPLKAASYINRWVYKSLKKEGTVSLPNARDVLKTGVGDCNEHSALFAALARASGIPTKLVMGTIYIDGRFYYHAWNEVFVGEWIAVDSTYGQLPADATHIKFIEGDLKKSREIMKVVGKINIKILDAS